MSVITVAQPKGGPGKSTIALLLGLTFSADSTVALLDADPNQPLVTWAEGLDLGSNLRVVEVPHKRDVAAAIEQANTQSEVVIVDTEGIADLRILSAINASDLVLLPCQGSILDQQSAVDLIQAIRNQKHQPYHAVVMNRTSAAIRPKDLTATIEQFKAYGIAVLETEILERTAYRSLFSFGTTFNGLAAEGVTGVNRAIDNASALASEVRSILEVEKAVAHA
jgi:chromosome partitioning protein